jgi:NADH dehydrogenase
MAPSTPHRVVVVGGGFGGLQAVRALRRAPVEITLVDRRNFHLFQPLLYQVATGALSPGEIASPLRGMFKRRRDVRVVLGEVRGFDLERHHVLLERMADGEARAPLEYDTLVVAAGAAHAYFGHDEWRHAAPGLKTLEDAIEIRARILAAFEAAEVEDDPDRQAAWLTFVVVGAGPTGVEMAGQIAEIAKDTLANDFHRIDPRGARILLLEGADRVLGTFPPKLSARAARALERLGVTLMVDHLVVGVSDDAVEVQGSDGAHERIPARTVVWAAGVRASRLAAALGEATGAPVDKAGRVTVASDLTLPGHPEVIALGDMVRVSDADGGLQELPGVAPTAMQEGRYAANVILARLKGAEHVPFHYVDKGNVATIGRLKAVADIRGMRLSGTLAWLTWLFVHLFYLVGLQNRTLVFIRWVVSFMTRGRGARLITGESLEGGAPAGEQGRETREAARGG